MGFREMGEAVNRWERKRKLAVAGTQVHVSGFGRGEVIETDKAWVTAGYVMVRLRRAPDVRYNMGNNPALMCIKHLQALPEKRVKL